jgi:hypothetical protein
MLVLYVCMLLCVFTCACCYVCLPVHVVMCVNCTKLFASLPELTTKKPALDFETPSPTNKG